ncbi:GNAT family N-acetyltransferase [Streptomyces odontomachi]|uniref:GNAT family N-acetyltransferase n=1 Tax=Streptomyces odontomachi TaxID=2944940 RepID=UPI002108FC96|nr:GNAT family N-acetyltransferase [Streptomyces sp. ODS25]
MDTAPPPATGALLFRDALHSEAEELVALIDSAYRGESGRPGAGWTTEAEFLKGQRTDPQGVLEVIDGTDGRLFVVERDGLIVGCFQLERRGDSAYFGMFAVRPALQGAGLGKSVIAEAERYARQEWGAREMQMTVLSVRADLMAWYERRGYRRTGRTSPFPYGDERFGIPQRPGLEFELLVKPLS